MTRSTAFCDWGHRMILLATNKRDVTTDFIVREMERRAIPFFRLNAEDIGEYQIEMQDGDPARLRLERHGRTINLSDVQAAYYRRPQPPRFYGHRPSVAEYLQAEWSAVLRTLWNALDGRWLNCPFAILRAEDKPRQLSLARRSGFQIPATYVTNDHDSAVVFTARHACVAKPLRHALIDEGEAGKVIFTSRVDRISRDDVASIEMAPVIFQQEIPKACDVRVIVVDNHVFATGIYSQEWDETRIDWRKGVRTDLEHRTVTLPSAVQSACVSVTKALGLRYSAIDLVEDPNGAHWFLEANPNGQWAWIEQRTGARISSAIVEAFAT